VSRPRVVCVDDDASIRRFVELALEDLPVELLTCADATTARELLRQGPVALLITDLMMPGESGFELLASLMADPALRGGALLAVFSAGLNATTRARLEGLDVWRELDKPVSLQALEACVAEAVALSQAGTAGTSTPAATPFSLEERQAVDQLFGGDAELFVAFRDQALKQFKFDRLALAAAVDAGDWPAVNRQAHSLKGALATLGDARGQELAFALESAAAAADAGGCAQRWRPLNHHLSHL
jgi:CheY-like chemotaxis protein